MTGLVDDLLLLARLDAGRAMRRGDVDLSALVVDAVSDAHVAGPHHPVQLEMPDGPVVVTGDPARLHQVVANLLSNASTHTPPGTTVTVSLSPGDGEAVLTVADDGPGIPPAVLPHVFERFARADTSRSRATGSTGLGLAIAAAVVQAHGGDIHVTSRPAGTAFTVRLPVAGSPAAARAADTVPSVSAQPGSHRCECRRSLVGGRRPLTVRPGRGAGGVRPDLGPLGIPRTNRREPRVPPDGRRQTADVTGSVRAAGERVRGARERGRTRPHARP